MTTDRSRFILVFMEMFLLDRIFFSFERCCVATASLVFTSRTDVPSSVTLEPRFLRIVVYCHRLLWVFCVVFVGGRSDHYLALLGAYLHSES